MKCSLCGFDEDSLLRQKDELLQKLKERLNEINLSLNLTKETYATKNGFSDEVKEKVKTIKSELHTLKIGAILDNTDSMISIEPKLIYIVEYVTKYYRINKVSKYPIQDSRITVNSQLSVVIQEFLSEPKSKRYLNECKELHQEECQLNIVIRELEQKKSLFVKKEIPSHAFDFSSNLVDYLKNNNFLKGSFIEQKNVILCPYCSYLFREASSAAYQITKQDNSDDDEDYEY